MERHTDLAEVLHAQNRRENVLRFLVQHQDLPYRGPGGGGHLEPRRSLCPRSRDGGGWGFDGGVEVEHGEECIRLRLLYGDG